MKMKAVAPSAKQLAFRDALIATIRTHIGDLSAQELLAITAHLVGQILAMQDQRTMTPAMGMTLIADNIEAGNQEVISGLTRGTSEGTA